MLSDQATRYVRLTGAIALIFALSSMSALQARVFTDLEGRKVEAEIAGVRNGKVVLNVNGKLAKWPLEKLIDEDQEHIKIWALNRPPTKVIIRTSHKDAGTDIQTRGESNTREDRRVYELNIYNQTYQDTGAISVLAYVFVRMENGTVVPRQASFQLQQGLMGKGVYAREHEKLTSAPIGIKSSKTVTRTMVYTTRSDGSLDTSTRKSLSRSSQEFEGIWVRVFSKGRMIGETKDLSAKLERDGVGWPG